MSFSATFSWRVGLLAFVGVAAIALALMLAWPLRAAAAARFDP